MYNSCDTNKSRQSPARGINRCVCFAGMVAQASTEPTKSLKKANGHTSSIINVHAVRMLWVAAMGLFLVVRM